MPASVSCFIQEKWGSPGLACPVQEAVGEVADAPVKYLPRASGRDAKVEAVKHALLQQASYNRAARRGEYSAAMEGT